jgi:hypothetical protein
MFGVIVRSMVRALTIMVVEAVRPLDVRAVIVTVRSTDTCDVVMTNWCCVAPAGTRVLAGTAAALGRLLVKVISDPPAGAGALITTVPTVF